MAETNNHHQERIGGLKDFINHTNVIGNVIAAASSQKNSFEPLPFANYSLFEETYGKFCVFKLNFPVKNHNLIAPCI
jgi:hypothetical protein